MPDGEMSWHQSDVRLAGHACGTIVLHFNFPSGSTSSGERYAGRSRRKHGAAVSTSRGQRIERTNMQHALGAHTPCTQSGQFGLGESG